ncbi:MAG TPA: hypothetical protein VIP05_28170, partial [Burkholderiaceae bacterium]
MPVRSSARWHPSRPHALALVALGVLAACSKEPATAPVAAAPDVAASDAMAPLPAPAPVATQAPVQAPAQLPAPARAPTRVAANGVAYSDANAPIEYEPPAAGGYANESTSPDAPVYADDPDYANDDQQQVISVWDDPPLEQPAPVAVDWAPPPMLVEEVPPPPYQDAVWTGGYWGWQGRWVWC